MKYGWRAAFYLLCSTYYRTYGYTTIRTIISHWAPDNENNTEAYIKRVQMMTGLDPSEYIGKPTQDKDTWLRLGWAMATVENGKQAMRDMDGLDEYEGFKMAMAACYPEGR